MDQEAIALVIGIVLALNAVLFGLHTALGYIKDKTSNTFDNKMDDVLQKILGFLQKVVEVVGPVSTVKVESKPEPEQKSP